VQVTSNSAVTGNLYFYPTWE